MIAHINHPVPNTIRIKALCNLNQLKLFDTQEESRKEAHDFWEFLYLDSGRLNVLVDGELFTLSPGDLILYPPHSFHSVAMSKDAVAVCISFSTDSTLLYPLTGRLLLIQSHAQQIIMDILALKNKLFTNTKDSSLVRSMTFRGMELRNGANPAEIQKLSNLLEVFLIDLNNAESRSSNSRLRDSVFATLTSYLKSNLNRTMTLEEMSKECAISVSQLQKLCRGYCGCGPITYFLSLKIGAAKQMMEEGQMNFTEIAESLGFSSVHYFSRLFKSKTKMSPSEYLTSISKAR